MNTIIKKIILISIFLILLSGCSISRDKTVSQSSENLKSTIIASHMEEKIEKGKNLLYCSTFQLAWNELKDDIIKDRIKLDTAMPMVDSLNKSLSTKKDVSKDAVVAMAGFGKGDIVEKINRALSEKFKGDAPVVKEKLGPDDILAYGYLSKNLEFQYVFDKLKEPISFQGEGGTSNVKGFGIKEYVDGEKYENIGRQVKVYDYKSDSDFVILLESKAKDDDIILAMIEPKQNLLDTAKQILERIKNGKRLSLEKGDSLQIPSMDFDIKHSFKELVGRELRNKGFEEYSIVKAIQNTKFKLDEKGATLKSEAKMEVMKSERVRERKEMHLEFNKPYLIMLKDKKAEMPYFALWAGNDELLKK